MRIISVKSTRFTCQHCLTVAEYEVGDIRFEQIPPGYDEYEHHDSYYVKCPVCNAKIDISPTTAQKNSAKFLHKIRDNDL